MCSEVLNWNPQLPVDEMTTLYLSMEGDQSASLPKSCIKSTELESLFVPVTHTHKKTNPAYYPSSSAGVSMASDISAKKKNLKPSTENVLIGLLRAVRPGLEDPIWKEKPRNEYFDDVDDDDDDESVLLYR